MLESNQRPPPCKLGQGFPGGYCPVGKSRLDKQFLPFLAPPFSCSVRVRPAPVAAWLQHRDLSIGASLHLQFLCQLAVGASRSDRHKCLPEIKENWLKQREYSAR